VGQPVRYSQSSQKPNHVEKDAENPPNDTKTQMSNEHNLGKNSLICVLVFCIIFLAIRARIIDGWPRPASAGTWSLGWPFLLNENADTKNGSF